MILMFYCAESGNPRLTWGFVALQRETADNFRLAMRAGFGNSAFARM